MLKIGSSTGVCPKKKESHKENFFNFSISKPPNKGPGAVYQQEALRK